MVDTQKIFDYDKQFLCEEIKHIAGIDEVGRGPLAGPVVTACVVMPYDEKIDGVFDSKKISAKKRDILYDKIKEKAISISISKRDQNRIDEINILEATKESMKGCFNSSKVKPDLCLIDAVKLGVCENEKSIVKGDETSYAIACASIIAKVYRDRLMKEYAEKYPEYDFANNVGYGTKKHIEALKEYGITPIHRLSFIKNIMPKEDIELEIIRRERS